ncbi:MAG: hypothetical protein F6J97_02395, partial [Leptolyngbya sp. SIO4C1]|nr:hypothetical protein [Leptolyngbya sp. SIO4C1]
MSNWSTRARSWLSVGLRSLILIALIAGLVFRFGHLDRKVYQHDEAFTSMRISGYAKTDIEQQLFTGRVITAADIDRYQRPGPDRNLADALRVLADYAEHPPLYYLMTRFWAQAFGSSVATVRSLAALISLLIFPSLYWLCRSLYGSPKPAWIAIALVAVSPLHVLYAQEARQYSLTAVMTVLTSAVLLFALRRRTWLSWLAYAGALTLGLYSNLLFGLVALAHAVYVVGAWRKLLWRYLQATALAVAAFVPWIAVVIVSFYRIRRFTRNSELDLPALVKWWARNANNLFFDFHPSLEPYDPLRFDDVFLAPLAVALIAYALYVIYRQTPKRIWLLVWSLTLVPVLPLALMDALQGGLRSTAMRYVIPACIGIQLAVAFLLAAKLSVASRQRRIWQGAARRLLP